MGDDLAAMSQDVEASLSGVRSGNENDEVAEDSYLFNEPIELEEDDKRITEYLSTPLFDGPKYREGVEIPNKIIEADLEDLVSNSI